MPLQTPQWTEVLSCPICCKDFSPAGRQPVSLSCGHTVCRMCLSKLHRQQCPFDQTAISKNVDKLPTNYAILQLVVGPEVMLDASRDRIPDGMKPADFEIYLSTQRVIEELALYLKPLNKSTNGSQTGSLNSSSGGNQLLSRPIQRKLVTLVNCQLVEEEGRARAVRAARSLGERVVTELIIQHQNPQQLSTNLWAAVRARGCQFLGPAMQEETLKLVLLALEDGTPLSRKVLVMFVVQKLEQQFPQASKTSVGHVVQLLYRASCFKVTKREEESSLMQLKEEFRNYEALRREHDAQIVQIAIEGGLRISPEQWSSLLYGDLNHKSHMQSIIDKLQTPASFTSSIQELTICLQRSGDPVRLAQLHCHLEKLAAIDPSPGAMSSSWEKIKSAVDAVKKVLQGLMDFMQNYSQNKKALDLQTQNIKYKTSLCRDVQQKGGCPRGPSCTFAHSEEELERYRSKSRQLLSMLNNQAKNQKNLRSDEKLLHQHIMEGNIDLSAILGETTLSWPGSEMRPLSARGVPANPERRLSHGSSVPHLENGMVQRPSPEGESQEEDSTCAPDLVEKIQSSLLGLQESLTIPDRDMAPRGGMMTRGKESSDLVPRSRSHQTSVSTSSSSISRSSASPNAQLYLANRSMSRNDSEPSYSERGDSSVGGGGSSGGRLPQSQQQLDHHRDWLLTARDVPQSEGRYSIPQEDDYYYERRLAAGYRPPPSESPLAYKNPSDPAPPLQPRILIPTNPPPPPSAPERYLEQKAYIQPLGGRYHYPDPQPPIPPSRPTAYRRPAVQRYVDPHTLKAYDVVPAEDYAEPSAPPVPSALVPSHEYHLRQRQEESMYRDHVDFRRNYYAPPRVAPNMSPAPPIGTVLIPSPRDMPDEPVAGIIRKKAKTPPVIAPPHPNHPTKVERGPSLTELKERQDYLKTMLDGMQDENTKDWKAVSKPSSSWPSAPQRSSESDYSMSKPSSLTQTSSIWTSPTTSTIPTSSSLQFNCGSVEDDDEDNDHDHRNNGIDVDDEDDLLSKPVRDDDEDDDGHNLSSHNGRSNGECSSSGSYNHWTSTPLFTPNTGKAKETSTNYTMTYSKVLVRHMSANENEEGAEQGRHMGAHGKHDFEAMSMGDLKRTLNEVKQQDKRAGSSHHERTSKIQMEMVRRNDDADPDTPTTSLSTSCHHVPHHESSPISNTNNVPLPAQLVTKKPILHLYTKYDEEEPPVPHQRGRATRIYEPASRTARSMGRNTVPLKVSAGMVDNTMPVNMTVQDCQVAPGFQNPDMEGYYIRTAQGRVTDPLGSCSIQPQDDWESKVDELVECDPKAEQKLKQALSKVRTQIQAKETRKDAHNTFILNFEEQALGNLVSAGDPRMHEHTHGLTQTSRAEAHMQMPVSAYNPVPQPESRAIKMQESVLSRYSRQASLPQPGAQPPLPRPAESPFTSSWSMGSGGSSGSSGASMPPTRGGGLGGGGSWQDYPPAAAYHQPSRQWTAVPAERRMMPVEPPMERVYTTADRARRPVSETKEMMELTDQRIAEEMQKEYQADYIHYMEQQQRSVAAQQQRKMQEHNLRLQEEMDRKKAQEIAMRDAIARGYTY